MNMPCNSKIDCVDTENPFNNVSSEAPDAIVFLSRFYSNPQLAPALGANWTSTGCIGTCQSTVSQADADACAEAQAIQCIADHNNVPPKNPVVDPPGTPTPDPVAVFGNTEQSCTVNCPDGFPFVYVVRAGTFTALNQASADRMAHSYACAQATTARVCLGTLSLSECCVNTAYTGTIVATGSLTYSFSVVSGSLPPGTSLVATGARTAIITGTPTAIGVFTFKIEAVDPRGSFMQKTYSISVVGIATSSPLASGIKGTPYSQTLTASGTTAGAVRWAIAAGALPAGLILNSTTGEISGTPTASGTSSFTILMTDATVGCTKDFQITIASSCADWASIAWDPPQLLFTPPALATGSSSGASFTGDVLSGINAPGATAIFNGFFDYKGLGCTANLHIDITINTLNGNQFQVNIRDVTTGDPFVFLQDYGANPVGGYDAVVTLPDTGGVVNQFNIIVTMSIAPGLFHPYEEIAGSGTFSNP